MTSCVQTSLAILAFLIFLKMKSSRVDVKADCKSILTGQPKIYKSG